MAGGRPVAVLEVSAAERRVLESLAQRCKTAQALTLCARIVLHYAEGLPNIEVVNRLGEARPSVGKRRRRFVSHRLDGLHDEPRPGVYRSITDDHVANVVTLTLASMPRNGTHWRTRSMAERAGLFPDGNQPDLEGFRPPASSREHGQDQRRPAVRRQGS